MGGAAAGVLRPIAEGVGDAVDRMFSKSMDSPFVKNVASAFWSMGRTLDSSPTGQDVKRMILKGVEERQKAINVNRAPIDAFQKLAKNDDDLAKLTHLNTARAQAGQNPISYKDATLSEIHGSLPQGHAGKIALDPLMATPANHHLTLDDLGKVAQGKANLAGRTMAFGPDSVHLTAALHPLLTSQHPADQSEAQAIMDIASQVFRDTTEMNRQGKVTKESFIKNQVAENINRFRAEDKKIKINVGRTYYSGDRLEEAAHRITMNVMAPFIGIVHMSDFMKLPMNLPARALWDTFQSLNDPMINGMKDSSGIFNHTMHSIIDNDFRYRTGAVAQRIGSPDAAAIFHKMWHQPLFNNIRMKQISIFGTAAYHQAQIWGKLAAHGDGYAIDSLKDLNLDPTAIARRGGILTREELEHAIYHFVDNRLFIDKPLEHAKWTKNNPFMRVAFDLHGYATREGKFISRELYKLMKHNEYGKFAQFVGVLGIAFPMVAPLIKSAGTMARTLDPEQAKDDLTKSYGGLFHPEGVGDFLGTYIDLIAHFAGIGAYWSYLHAATNHRLAVATLGALPGKVLGTTEDAFTGMKYFAKDQSFKHFKPVGRDAVGSLPILGPIVSHYAFPKERTGTGGSSKFRIRRRR